jgi:hypothetical protein
VYAEAVADADGDVPDLRVAATLRLPGGVLGQLDIGLDEVRRDELELVGSEGRLVLPDPWICRQGAVDLVRDGNIKRIYADPDGAYGLRGEEGDVYRIEFDAVSTAIRGGTPWPYGRDDAVAQARVLAALHESGADRQPVSLGG